MLSVSKCNIQYDSSMVGISSGTQVGLLQTVPPKNMQFCSWAKPKKNLHEGPMFSIVCFPPQEGKKKTSFMGWLPIALGSMGRVCLPNLRIRPIPP